MKTLIKSTLFASFVLASGMAAAAGLDEGFSNQSKEAIMGYGQPTTQLFQTAVSVNETLDMHPIEGIYMQLPTAADAMAKSHCVNLEIAFSAQSTENQMGEVRMSC